MAAVGATTSQADHGKGKGSHRFPAVIQLPTGFQPEGIEIGKGNDLLRRLGRDGCDLPWRPAHRPGRDPGSRLRRAAALPDRVRPQAALRRRCVHGRGYVYDARTGALVEDYEFATAPTFINDVVVTRTPRTSPTRFEPVFYNVPSAATAPRRRQTIPLSGDYTQVAGFNLNGIDATPNGKFLVAVQTANGLLPDRSETGVAKPISLGGESVPYGDGILLDGKKLYVVQNQNNPIAVVRLSSDLTSARRAHHHRPELRRPDDDRRVRSLALRGQRPFR